MDPISVGYSDPPAQESAIKWLRSKHAAHKHCRYPNKHGISLNRNSIRVATDRYKDWLTVLIDVDIEDTPPVQQRWPGPFLYLNLQLCLNLSSQATSTQEQLDAYLSYDNREVAITKEYQRRIERYTRGKLALIHTQEGWRIRHLNQLRRALEFWNVENFEDDEIE